MAEAVDPTAEDAYWRDNYKTRPYATAGTAYDHPDVAAFLVTLAKEKAATDAYFSTSVKAKIGTKDVVNFSSTAGLSAEALSHRFDRKAG